MNNIMINGNLTNDPTIKTTKTEKAVATTTVAVKRTYANETDFFDIECWERQAEYLSKYGHKGDMVVLCGEMVSHKYDDIKTDTKRISWKIRVTNITILSKAEKSSDESLGKSVELPLRNEKEANVDVEDLRDDLPF